MSPPISVIIPTLDASQHLPRCIDSLRAEGAENLVRQIIVSDGGSGDGTLASACAAGATTLNAPRGRAKQLIAGAETAIGEWFLFLHADTALSPDWARSVRTHMTDAPDKAAVFTLAYDADHSRARWLAARANRRTRWFALPYGDQGLLISRKLYESVGGYPDIALMEDVAIVRALGRKRLSALGSKAITSAEKYERDGYRKRAYRNGWLLLRYLTGTPPDKLATLYD